MIDLFKFFGKEESKSKDIAKERLKLVLIHDRANISPKFLDMIKDDIIKVISNYMEIEEAGLDIRLSRIPQEDDTYSTALVANIPIRRVKNMGPNRG
ncbi:MAG: cell division topological specificity factor MinE [Caldicoprobacter oshimai]|uniref:Cell division topological specificity factor n=1 Tax=Caldicoprobacter faecalis TaxID=937334 RepID=A0A1I5TWB3_9FIRM|nr:cell division topological specificity factor MinE [Caldicoprobacter faecalis]PZN11534.1 MAG: cell division topological specificity factor MinE [Caldicoprobacter oshimai]SFP87181.1 cell division topological specificity factor MinE [Caldicoprobacter faecalis]